jgi:hypothetical protein
MAAYIKVECAVCRDSYEDLHPSFPVCSFCYLVYDRPKTLEQTLEQLVKNNDKESYDPNHPVNRFMRYLEYPPTPHKVWQRAVDKLCDIGFAYDYTPIPRPPHFDKQLKRTDYGEYA